MTRAERIAERLTGNGRYGVREDFHIAANWFLDGDFNDLLGPEVSADIAPTLLMLAEEMEKQADLNQLASAEHGKKVAEFLRALAKMVSA